jgi:hypothetical protein
MTAADALAPPVPVHRIAYVTVAVKAPVRCDPDVPVHSAGVTVHEFAPVDDHVNVATDASGMSQDSETLLQRHLASIIMGATYNSTISSDNEERDSDMYPRRLT